jgi:hypothetical protein
MHILLFDPFSMDAAPHKKSLAANWVLLSLINFFLTIPLRRRTQRLFHSRKFMHCLISDEYCMADRGGDGI